MNSIDEEGNTLFDYNLIIGDCFLSSRTNLFLLSSVMLYHIS